MLTRYHQIKHMAAHMSWYSHAASDPLTLVNPEMLLHQGRLRHPNGNYSLQLE